MHIATFIVHKGYALLIPSIDPWIVPEIGCLSHPELAPGGGCCDLALVTDCSVQNFDYLGFSTLCYCNEACYYFDYCCDDILEIGCFGKLLKECLDTKHFEEAK